MTSANFKSAFYGQLLPILAVAANRALLQNPHLQSHLFEQNGRLAQIVVTGVQLQLNILINHGQFELLTCAQIVDTSLSASAFDWWQIARGDAKKANLQIVGDANLAASLQYVFANLDVDFLSLFSAAQASHPQNIALGIVGKIAGKKAAFAKHSLASLQHSLRDYLNQESELIASAVALESFADKVDKLRSDTERLQAKLQKMKSQFGPMRP